MVHQAGVPESFKVLVKEFQALGLDVSMIDSDNKEISLKELEEEESKEGVILSVDEIKDEVRELPPESNEDELDDELEEDMEDLEPTFDDEIEEFDGGEE